MIEGANHFFTDRIDDLMSGVNTHLDAALAAFTTGDETEPTSGPTKASS